MSAYTRISTVGLQAAVLILAGGLASCGESPSAAATAENVEGLWRYTRLQNSGGREMPLTGIFLFKDGTFLQQSVFNGEPIEQQGAMAHAGPYTVEAGAVQLIAEQTIRTAPGTKLPLSFRRKTEHEVSVTRSGDDLKLVFGSGTIQEFERIGPGEGELYSFQDGALALVDGHFILVQGNEEGSLSGYGTYERNGKDLELDAVRWAEAGPSGAESRQDITIDATFDGKALQLSDGTTFYVEG